MKYIYLPKTTTLPFFLAHPLFGHIDKRSLLKRHATIKIFYPPPPNYHFTNISCTDPWFRTRPIACGAPPPRTSGRGRSPRSSLWCSCWGWCFASVSRLKSCRRFAPPPRSSAPQSTAALSFLEGKNANSLWYMAVVKDKLVLHTFLLYSKISSCGRNFKQQSI